MGITTLAPALSDPVEVLSVIQETSDCAVQVPEAQFAPLLMRTLAPAFAEVLPSITDIFSGDPCTEIHGIG
jgi:hypothetical protein